MKRAVVTIGIERGRDGVPLPDRMRANALAEVRTLAAKTFGGYTLTNAAGGWFNPQGVLVEEGAIQLTLYTELGRASLIAFAREAARMFYQHSVVLEWERGVEFVESDDELVEAPSQGNYAAERAA